jgi:hypothetical protein
LYSDSRNVPAQRQQALLLDSATGVMRSVPILETDFASLGLLHPSGPFSAGPYARSQEPSPSRGHYIDSRSGSRGRRSRSRSPPRPSQHQRSSSRAEQPSRRFPPRDQGYGPRGHHRSRGSTPRGGTGTSQMNREPAGPPHPTPGSETQPTLGWGSTSPGMPTMPPPAPMPGEVMSQGADEAVAASASIPARESDTSAEPTSAPAPATTSSSAA